MSEIRLLMLATDAHGGAGGIAQFNRNLLDALTADPVVKEIVVVPRHLSSPPTGLSVKLRYLPEAAGNMWRYLVGALTAARSRPDLIYCAHLNVMPIAWLCGLIAGAPVILLVHGIEVWDPNENRLGGVYPRLADRVLSVSEVTRRRLIARSGMPGERIAVIPNCIRIEQFGPGPKRADLVERLELTGAKVVLTLGRMASDERYKGFDRVIMALPELRRVEPAVVFLAVGGGDDRPSLEALARKHGVADIVRFAGEIDEADKADYLRLADAFVLASTGEGFGIVVLEALACGAPVVASAADGSQEAVLNGALGQVVDPHDPVALREAILAALAKEKRVPEGLSRFAFEKVAEQQRAALHGLLAEFGRGNEGRSDPALARSAP